MFIRNVIAVAIALACIAPVAAQDAELAKIRGEIKQMRESYEKRIEELERRLSVAEAKAGRAETAASKAEQSAGKAETAAAAASPAGGAGRSGENAFNPAMSLIMQGSYARTSRDPNQFRITGFMPSGGEVGPPKRNFGLNETELNISANIDPYFRGVAIAAIAPEGGIAVEEAYFQTLALSDGFTLKGGRFFSGLGYQNEQHQHAWDFRDAPLPYKAFLGNQLKQDGVQLKWLAPTDLFMEFGAELASGDRFPGGTQNKNGIGSSSVFGHLGGDIGDSTAWRSGVSHLWTSPNGRSYTDTDTSGNSVTNTFAGRARLLALDGILKWAPHGNSTERNFKLQGEYFRLKQDGTLTYNDSSGSAIFNSVSGPLQADQSGYYVQGVWQFYPRWRVGYRYDALRYGTLNNGVVGPGAANFPLLANYSPSRNTLMLDFSATEFSRFRLQLAADKSRLGVTDNQVMLQYIHSLGAHGAHKF